jgi:hypothetical protein
MNKKLKISAAAFAVFLLAVLAVNLAAASIAIPKTANSINVPNTESSSQPITPSNTNPATSSTPTTTTPPNPVALTTAEDVEKLKTEVPKTLQETEANILPTRTRYLMYTNDGVHIMWGVFGNGRFVGTDNQGKSCWGIYGQGIFAGFYNGEFFWGKYSNTNTWKAEYLFGLKYSEGKYVKFPSPTATASTNAP